ncbi:MAG: hypothetical protein NVS1B4_12050 [Gemmatimonadaceae bacterium]
MTHSVAASLASREAGRQAGDGLAKAHVVVVAGDDPEVTAQVALGIGDAQCLRRRVAVGDLVGALPSLDGAVADDNPPGLVDCFRYGVSLTRIARPVVGKANLFVLPSGTESIDSDVFSHPRWRRFVGGFREADAMLVLVARAAEPGLVALRDIIDGVVIVDAAIVPRGLPILARVASAVPDVPAAAGAGDVGLPHVPGESYPSVERRGTPRGWRLRRLRDVVTVGVLAATGLIVLGVRYGPSRRLGASVGPVSRHIDSASAMLSAARGVPFDVRATGADMSGQLVAADSTNGLRYAVEVAAMNTVGGAMEKLRSLAGAPAATVSPIELADQTRWFTIVVGATRTVAGGDSMLLALRRSAVLDPDGGAVVPVPIALVVEDRVARDSAAGRVGQYLARGLPVYALLQADGTARLYAGAFATAAQSSLLAQILRTAGITPTVAFRTGSTF